MQDLSVFDDLAGPSYLDVLSAVHRLFAPRRYLEIGTSTGASLRIATCASIAVDPKFRLSTDVIGDKPELILAQQTSDAFFEGPHARDLVVDLAFIDGLHLFEVVLRDFINVERRARRNSIIVLHDCLPTDVRYTSRFQSDHAYRSGSRHPEWWAGDVWKIIPILRRLRPDLKILCLDAAPTGLVLVSDLDPSSSVLAERYRALVDEWAEADLKAYTLPRLFEEADVRRSSEVMSLEGFSRHFRGP